MLLAVDVGNSHTTIGVFAGAGEGAAAAGPTELRCELRVSTRHAWTRDEVAIGLGISILFAICLGFMGLADGSVNVWRRRQEVAEQRALDSFVLARKQVLKRNIKP